MADFRAAGLYVARRVRHEDRGHDTPCWVWQLGLTEKGYARAEVPGYGRVRIHRLTYEILNGPIPVGLVIDHLCSVPSCCNPDHLEAVTDEENRRRAGMISGTELCIRGHGPENRNSSGTCRLCRAELPYMQSTPENRAKRAAYMREWVKRNPEKNAERNRKYRAANRSLLGERRRASRALKTKE